MKKVNSVVAKALAQKTLSELKSIVNKEAKEQQEILSTAIDKDPLSIEFNESLQNANQLLKSLHKKYKIVHNGIDSSYYGRKSITIKDYYNYPGHNFLFPSEDDIKNDIILQQASSEDRSFDADKLIADLLEKYKKQLFK